MVGLLIQFLLSYLIIYGVERGNLSSLGLSPNKHRLKEMLLFLIIAGTCSSITFFLRMYFGQERWELNPLLNLKLLANGAWYTLKSVLYEELIFRGILFYLLVKKIGGKYALLISASAFGIYHWFTYEIFSDIQKMIYIFLMTSAAGIIYGLGYLKTGSLLIPISMHFGWNFVNAFVFSNGNIGPGIFIEIKPLPVVSVSYFIYFVVTLSHFILFFLINFFILRKRNSQIHQYLSR